jgi:hypothetical protein
MPIATGIAISNPNSEDSTVTTSRSRIPNRRFVASVVLNSALVRKLTLSAITDG